MYTLLPDETFCKTDLGLLLYSKRKIYDFDVYIVNTRLPTSFFGHVEYCALIKAVPRKPLSETKPRFFCFTTRFRDLSSLHSKLSTIHRQLYLKDTFPTFVDAKYFGSTTPETIEERGRAINALLNFAVKNSVLSKTKVLQQFFETAKEVVPNNNGGYVNSENETLIVEKSVLNSLQVDQNSAVVIAKEEKSDDSNSINENTTKND